MEGRYVLELRDRDPATVEDLVLDGCESAEIEGLSDKLVKLQDGLEGEDSGDESGSDLDGPGLSYLDNSQLDEDESEEYKPDDLDEETTKRGLKRRNEETNGDESGTKKKADE
ncbi:hypothetical protein OSTOST_08386 [Ostertagia ostertagi]